LILWQLFVAFFRVGLLSVGGGYVLIPLIKSEVVFNYRWLSQDEFLEVLGVTQGIPGAISVKFATFTGYKIAGLPGVAVANLAVLLPPVLMMLALIGFLYHFRQNRTFLAFLYSVRFATVGLLLAVTLSFAQGMAWEGRGVVLTILAFVLLTVVNLHPGLVILSLGGLGAFFFR
jgi:chromate transporter